MPEGALVLHARVGRTRARGTAANDAVLTAIVHGGAADRGDPDVRRRSRVAWRAGARGRIERLHAWTRRAVDQLRNDFARLPARRAPVPAPVIVLGVLLLALWPHWIWMARRLTDGSDEPWGVLALATVLVLVAREWRALRLPARAALSTVAALAVTAAAARLVTLPIVAAAIAMVALATFLAAARRDQPALPLASLLLLALPVIASLQFYFGYPLRVATAALAAPVLHALGFAAQAQGAALVYAGRTVLVDPPCAGIGMLWVGAYTAALLSYLAKATARQALRNTAVAAASVFCANVLRNVALFFPEGLDLHWPAWAHAAIGLAAFAAALVPIGLVASAPGRRAPGAQARAWPLRFHRQLS